METKLEQIIAEASAFSEYDSHTDDAFIRIRDLATEVLASHGEVVVKLRMLEDGVADLAKRLKGLDLILPQQT